jgi:hypothetical protein|uniref:Uncharacterized protein n=1 Tax=Anguilla anguilla TaxID=7936 RepID=A0A0E9SFG6_ANGAN
MQCQLDSSYHNEVPSTGNGLHLIELLTKGGPNNLGYCQGNWLLSSN